MTTDLLFDLLTALLQLSGAFLFLASAIAVWRLPDLASRIHGPTKAASLGIALLAAGLALHRLQPAWLLESALLVLFVFITVPLSAQILVKTARSCPRSVAAPKGGGSTEEGIETASGPQGEG